MESLLNRVKSLVGGEDEKQRRKEEEAEKYKALPRNHELSSLEACGGCAEPCEEYPKLPGYLRLDQECVLRGYMKPIAHLVIVGTEEPSKQWESHVEEGDPTKHMVVRVHEELKKATGTGPRSLVLLGEGKAGTVEVYPEYRQVRGVTVETAPKALWALMKGRKGKGEGGEEEMVTEEIPSRAVIMVCGHRKRDKRCGVAGPLIAQAFVEELKRRGLEEKVEVRLVSHTGGHKVAGNVLVYPAGVWYGRVVPGHVPAILNAMVERRVIEDLYRGKLLTDVDDQVLDRTIPPGCKAADAEFKW
ncbi:MAG: Sucrase/ferredoxin-like-domain-containing protein [Piptocephalis tieghemiana]|nr:MAG: Sucrase/ferredoxin-like-domain-containing protein [Piptocephalis tieghemiana]